MDRKAKLLNLKKEIIIIKQTHFNSNLILHYFIKIESIYTLYNQFMASSM